MRCKLDNGYIVLVDTKHEFEFVIPYYKKMAKHCVVVFNIFKNFKTINSNGDNFFEIGHCSFYDDNNKNQITGLNINYYDNKSLFSPINHLGTLLKDLKHFETLNLEHLFKKSYNTNYIPSKEKQIQHLQLEITDFKQKNNN